MMYKSEERFKKMKDEIEGLQALLRQKEKDIQLLTEKTSTLMDETLQMQRLTKLQAQDHQEAQQQKQSEERVILKQLQRIKELET